MPAAKKKPRRIHLRGFRFEYTGLGWLLDSGNGVEANNVFVGGHDNAAG